MKVVVSGSRFITDYDFVARAISESGFIPTLIIEGGQRTYDDNDEPIGGVDYLASLWAFRNGVDHEQVDAKWKEQGLAAGPIRNRKMAVTGDALVAIPKGISKGTRNMIMAMKMQGKPIFIKEA